MCPEEEENNGQQPPVKPRLSLAPHQARMVDEYADLDVKLTRLCEFLETPMFQTLDADERRDMESQANGMRVYANSLLSRIERFERMNEQAEDQRA